MAKNRVITVQGIPVTVSYEDIDDYICITDIAAAKSDNSRAADVIRNWLRNRSTLEFLSTWEEIYNPNFKVFESEHFKKEAGLVTFTPSVSEWVEKTNAVGLYVKRGKYGGTFAHKDIAFEFASAISPVFKLYLIKEFQRLKEAENDLQKLEWDAKRFLSKNNYLIQTDAVKNYLIPVCNYREDLQWLPYAEEADLLNVALFGFTAKAWRETNPELAKKQCVLWNVCRSVFHFLKKRIYRRINIIRCLLQSGISFFTKSKMIRFMWIISLTAVKITVGLSVKTEYQIHKSSLHSRWRFFCTQKGGAMIGSQDK